MTDLTPDELQIAFHDVECVTYDERFGIAYDERTAGHATHEARSLLGPRHFGRILDVGCGTGYLGLGLAATGAADEVHATDISAGMLERARRNADGLGVAVHLSRTSAAALPYRDATFDAVVSRGVLHHLHDPVAALREWRRVAKPQAPILVLSEPTPHADVVGGTAARATLRGLAAARWIGERIGRPLSAHPADDAEVHRYWDLVAMVANLHTFTPDGLAALGREAGFASVEVHGAGLASICWAAAYYVLVGELPALASSERARRRADRAWGVLRRFDASVSERVLPDGALLTVQAVFSG